MYTYIEGFLAQRKYLKGKTFIYENIC